MDEEIMKCLKELSKSVQDIGRMIGSERIDIDKLETCSDCLSISKDTIDTWIRILKDR